MNRKLLTGIIAIGSLLLSSCEKDLHQDRPSGSTPEEKFDFSTSQESQFNITLPAAGLYYEIYLENPGSVEKLVQDVHRTPFMRGTATSSSIHLSVNLPKHLQQVYVCVWQNEPQIYTANVNNGSITLAIPAETAASALNIDTRASVNGSYWKNWKTFSFQWQTLGNWDKEGYPSYISENIVLTDKQRDIIDATLPNEQNIDALYQLSDLELQKTSKVKVYFVESNTAHANALAYYAYSGDLGEHSQGRNEVNKKLTLVFPNLNNPNLKCGDGVQLKYWNGSEYVEEFPAGTKISWVLLIDAFHPEAGNQVDGVRKSNINAAYSYHYYNNYTLFRNKTSVYKGHGAHIAFFKADDRIIMSFEEQPWGYVNGICFPANFRDNVFIIEPKEALPDIPDGHNPDVPAYNSEITKRGILAFEDVWPHKGDYDMNDVVVKYKSHLYLTEDFEAVASIDTFTFLHNGAAYKNGFGYQLGASAADIKDLKITSAYHFNGQGIDKDLKDATVMLFDNCQMVEPETRFAVTTIYKQPVNLGKNTAPYNPFIVVNEERPLLGNNRQEVHLVNYNPTEKADPGLFNYGDDISDPDKNSFYVSDAKYPFAIHLAELDSFIVSSEMESIDKAYPKFNSWVESNGALDKDWYLYPVEKK